MKPRIERLRELAKIHHFNTAQQWIRLRFRQIRTMISDCVIAVGNFFRGRKY